MINVYKIIHRCMNTLSELEVQEFIISNYELLQLVGIYSNY